MQSPQVNDKKLYLGNLPFSMTEDAVRELCSEHGEVTDVKLITDFNTGRSRGFAFVEFASTSEAEAAIEALHEKEVDGRQLFVKVARPKAPREGGNRGGYRGGSRS